MSDRVRVFRSSRQVLDAVDDAALDRLLGDAEQRARADNPSVTLAPETFAGALARLCPAEEPVAEALARLQLGDVYFATACLAGDATAQRQLHERSTGIAVSFLARYGRGTAFIEDLVQDFCQKMLIAEAGEPPKLTKYSGRGPLSGFLRVALTRAAQNATRKKQETPIGDDEVVVAGGSSPEVDYLKRRYAKEFAEAFREVLASIEPADREMLKLHYLRGLTLEQIAEHAGVSRATAARRLAKVKGEIVEGTYRRLQMSMPGGSGQGDLLALVRSQLDLSISQHLD